MLFHSILTSFWLFYLFFYGKQRNTKPSEEFHILSQIVNKSKAAIVVGFVDPNGTRIFSFGNMSTAHNMPVNESTIFHIGSITKTFTTIILAEMVRQGLINLNDPIEKYLPVGVKVPDYKGHKITIEELATHTSALPEFPSNYGAFLPQARILDPNYNAVDKTMVTVVKGQSIMSPNSIARL